MNHQSEATLARRSSFTTIFFILIHFILLTSSTIPRAVSGFKFESLISSSSKSDSLFRSGLMVNTNKVVANSYQPKDSASEVSASSSPIITCDFDTYESTGCEDEEGSYCDTETQRCVCKEGFPIRLLTYCLPHKSIGDDCYTSSQCNQVSNAACFIFGKEYDNERISGGHNVGRQLSNWPTGTCRCNIGYQILPEIMPSSNSSNTGLVTGNDGGKSYEMMNSASNSVECIKKTVGSWCTDDWDCIKETFNTQCARPQNLCECSWGFYYDDSTDSCQIPKLFESKCTSDSDCSPEKLICSPRGRCVCPKGFHFDVIHPGCKPNDDSSCDFGYKWDEEWGRCIPSRISSSAAAAFPFNQINSRNKNPSDRNPNSASESSTVTTTSVFKDPSSPSSSNESSTFSTVLFILVPNLVLFAFLSHYCYFRKRDEDEDDDTSDLERGQLRSSMIRPTHNLFCSYPYHRNGHPTAIRNDAIGTSGTCCVPGDKLLASLVTGHHLHHHHSHHHHHPILPPSTLVTHDNSHLVNGQEESAGQESSAGQDTGEEFARVKSSATLTGDTNVESNTNSTKAVIEQNHPRNDPDHEISLPVSALEGTEKKIREKEGEGNENHEVEGKQHEKETKKVVSDSSSSANLSPSSILAENEEGLKKMKEEGLKKMKEEGLKKMEEEGLKKKVKEEKKIEEGKEEATVMSSRLSNGSDQSGNRGNDSRKKGEEEDGQHHHHHHHSETVQGKSSSSLSLSVGNEIKASQVIIDDKQKTKERMIDPANCAENVQHQEKNSSGVPCERDTSLSSLSSPSSSMKHSNNQDSNESK